MPDFRICVKQSKGSVCRGNKARLRALTVVGKQELAILVVGASRASLHVDLIVVIFSCALKQEAELERVTGFDPREAVGDVVNGPGRVRRIRPATERGEVGHVHRGNTVRQQLLSYRKDVLVRAARHDRSYTSL